MTDVRPWRNRVVEQSDVDPRTLTPHPLNPRRHPAAQLAALTDVLSQLGWLQDVIVNRITGRLLDGHARVEEAVRTGQPTVPVKWVELGEAEEMLALATFDPLGAIADIDQEATDRLLAQIRASDAQVTPALVQFLATLGTQAATEYPDPIQEATTYMLLIECKDEAEQTALLEQLVDAGEDCRALVS